MKNHLINKNQRESLLYSNFQELKYLFSKILNFQNYILRNKRIKKDLKDNKISKVQFGSGSGILGEAYKTSLSGYLDTDIFGNDLEINASKRYSFILFSRILYSSFCEKKNSTIRKIIDSFESLFLKEKIVSLVILILLFLSQRLLIQLYLLVYKYNFNK